jgi:hypothetical protein
VSRRRLDRLEVSLSPKEAVKHWLAEAQAFGSLPTYVESLIGQPATAQPFIALPSRVQHAVWQVMRRERPAFTKQVMREAIGDTIFLLRLVIDLNVHIEETLRIEGLRHAALMWWSRALDSGPQATDDAKPGGRSDWRREVSILRGGLLGTERARAAAEARYLGHGILFPELAIGWRDLCAAVERLADDDPSLDAEPARRLAEQGVERVVRMARAEGLDASGRTAAADDMAMLVARLGAAAPPEATDG